eukprot:g5102.t1
MQAGKEDDRDVDEADNEATRKVLMNMGVVAVSSTEIETTSSLVGNGTTTVASGDGVVTSYVSNPSRKRDLPAKRRVVVSNKKRGGLSMFRAALNRQAQIDRKRKMEEQTAAREAMERKKRKREKIERKRAARQKTSSYETYKSVKEFTTADAEAEMLLSSRMYTAKKAAVYVRSRQRFCPICGQPFASTISQAMNRHVEACMRRTPSKKEDKNGTTPTKTTTKARKKIKLKLKRESSSSKASRNERPPASQIDSAAVRKFRAIFPSISNRRIRSLLQRSNGDVELALNVALDSSSKIPDTPEDDAASDNGDEAYVYQKGDEEEEEEEEEEGEENGEAVHSRQRRQQRTSRERIPTPLPGATSQGLLFFVNRQSKRKRTPRAAIEPP